MVERNPQNTWCVKLFCDPIANPCLVDLLSQTATNVLAIASNDKITEVRLWWTRLVHPAFDLAPVRFM